MWASRFAVLVVSAWYRGRRYLEPHVQTAKAKITKRAVDNAVPPVKGEARIWDTDIKGFMLRIYPTGRKVYAVKCRVGRVQSIHTIGEHGSPCTPDEARKAALEALGRARRGEDPNAERKAVRAALTVSELIDHYLKEGPATKPAKRPTSWVSDGSNLTRHIRPLIGTKVADHVTKGEAAGAIRDIMEGKTLADVKTGPRGRALVTGGEGAARRTRSVAAAMFAWGMEHGFCRANPFAGTALATAPVRERFLTKDEAIALLSAISKLESAGNIADAFADALRLLLLTGARKSEVLGLRWTEVDFDRKVLTLPPQRTKAGSKTGIRRIQLSPPALDILERRRMAGGTAADGSSHKQSTAADFVFPATRGQGHAVGVRKVFERVCNEAKLKNLRIHDLRHSFASFAIADGASLFLVGKLLGHASSRTTERYAHLSGVPLQEAVTSIGRSITATDH
jgi:integrase